MNFEDSGELFKLVYYVIAIIIVLTVAILIETYRFQDCKKVGHSTMYCVFNVGK